ncbi:MAG TPA: hypothetical protein VFQ25_06075 [Ktedonobacterales bacterium]|nr:hypothetical protein [Ktedonobacterales bacterium]
MRIAAIILGALALVATAGGIFFYWIASAFICFDVCPPVSFVGQRLSSAAALSLGPGLLLSLAACILSLLALRAQGRSTAFLVTLAAPFVVIIAAVLILYVAGGSLTPVAVSGPPEVAPANRQVSSDWLNATRYAVMPLIIWPLVSFIAVLLRPGTPR